MSESCAVCSRRMSCLFVSTRRNHQFNQKATKRRINLWWNWNILIWLYQRAWTCWDWSIWWMHIHLLWCHFDTRAHHKMLYRRLQWRRFMRPCNYFMMNERRFDCTEQMWRCLKPNIQHKNIYVCMYMLMITFFLLPVRM